MQGASSNYSAVNEGSPDNDLTYVYQDADCSGGTVDTYNTQNFTGSGTIDSVVVTVTCKKQTASGTHQARTYLRLNSSDSSGTTSTLTTTYTGYSFTYQQKPGGGFWTASDVNAMEIGVKLTGGSVINQARCTQVRATIYFTGSVTIPKRSGSIIVDEDQSKGWLK